MQVRADQLTAHLAKGLRSLYTVWGDEPLLAQEALDALRSAARAAGCAERQIHIVSGARFDWSSLLGAAREMSLFSDRQLIEIRIPGGKPGKEGSDALQSYCDGVMAQGADNVTLVALPRLDRTQQGSAWFSALERAGATIRIDAIERKALPQWIAQRLAQRGQRVQGGEAGQHALAFFADRVEGNLLAAHQEIEKLGLLYPSGELSFEQIESAVLNVARYDVFKLGETLLAGDRARFVRMLEGLKGEGVAPPLILWAIAEEIRTLLRVSTAVSQRHPLQAAMRDARVWGARAELLPRALRRLQAAELEEALLDAAAADRVGKGLVRGDVWEALLRLGLRLMPAPAARPAEGNRGKISGQSASASKPR